MLRLACVLLLLFLAYTSVTFNGTGAATAQHLPKFEDLPFNKNPPTPGEVPKFRGLTFGVPLKQQVPACKYKKGERLKLNPLPGQPACIERGAYSSPGLRVKRQLIAFQDALSAIVPNLYADERGGKLAALQVGDVAVSDAPQLAQIIGERFGQPIVTQEKLSTGLGVPVTQATMSWLKGQLVIILTAPASELRYADLSVMTLDEWTTRLAQKQDARKRAADDL